MMKVSTTQNTEVLSTSSPDVTVSGEKSYNIQEIKDNILSIVTVGDDLSLGINSPLLNIFSNITAILDAVNQATAAQSSAAAAALSESNINIAINDAFTARIGTSVQAYNINTVIDSAYVHTDNNFTTVLLGKLNAIESGATADQTGAEIKSLYEAELDTNAYTDSEKAKVGYISVTQAVDLDLIETRVNQLDASVVLMGSWNASLGSFPSSTRSGESWIVSVAGTVNGITFNINDRIVSIISSASTTIYSGNWHKLDYTDEVLSVSGRTGSIVLTKTDVGLENVDNTSDLNKPISTAVNTALAGKSDTSHDHSGIYEPKDITILKDADIGTTVQAYDVATTKNDVANVFTAPQGSTVTAGANALNLTGSNCLRFTATAVNITVGTMATKKGQEFSVTIDSSENVTGWGTEFLFAPDFSAVTPTPPATMTGTMEFYMKVVEVNLVDGGTANKIHVAWAS